VRVALIGAGYFGQFHIDAWQRMEGAELVALVDQDPSKAIEGVPHFIDAVEMVVAIKPDIIDIASPPTTHLGLITALAPVCKNLICQKPFCRDLEEAEQALVAAGDARVIIHENIRNQPWYAEAVRLVKNGAVGAPFQVSFRMRPGDGQGPDAYLARQPYFQQMPRFLVHETAIHWIDLFRAVFGEPDGVYADLRRLNPAIAGEDAGVIMLDYDDGRRAVYDGNRLVDHIAEDRRRSMGDLLVEGETGVLRVDGEGRIWVRRFGFNDEHEHPFEWEARNFGGDCVYLSCAQYLEAFRSGAQHPTEAQTYLRNIRIENAVYESAETRCRVTL
jgi:predicted dehydrogenase